MEYKDGIWIYSNIIWLSKIQRISLFELRQKLNLSKLQFESPKWEKSSEVIAEYFHITQNELLYQDVRIPHPYRGIDGLENLIQALVNTKHYEWCKDAFNDIENDRLCAEKDIAYHIVLNDNIYRVHIMQNDSSYTDTNGNIVKSYENYTRLYIKSSSGWERLNRKYDPKIMELTSHLLDIMQEKHDDWYLSTLGHQGLHFDFESAYNKAEKHILGKINAILFFLTYYPDKFKGINSVNSDDLLEDELVELILNRDKIPNNLSREKKEKYKRELEEVKNFLKTREEERRKQRINRKIKNIFDSDNKIIDKLINEMESECDINDIADAYCNYIRDTYSDSHSRDNLQEERLWASFVYAYSITNATQCELKRCHSVICNCDIDIIKSMAWYIRQIKSGEEIEYIREYSSAYIYMMIILFPDNDMSAYEKILLAKIIDANALSGIAHICRNMMRKVCIKEFNTRICISSLILELNKTKWNEYLETFGDSDITESIEYVYNQLADLFAGYEVNFDSFFTGQYDKIKTILYFNYEENVNKNRLCSILYEQLFKKKDFYQREDKIFVNDYLFAERDQNDNYELINCNLATYIVQNMEGFMMKHRNISNTLMAPKYKGKYFTCKDFANNSDAIDIERAYNVLDKVINTNEFSKAIEQAMDEYYIRGAS